MRESGENVRFQVLMNGQVRATASVEAFGVLTFLVDWVRRDPARAVAAAGDLPPDLDPDEWVGNRVQVSLSGLDSVSHEHLDWWGDELKPGDEVTVRVVGPGEFDPPARRPSSGDG